MQTCDVCGAPAQAYYRNGIEWLCSRHCISEDDDWFIIDGDRTIIVDKEGLALWKKYRWRYTLSIRHLFRYETMGIKNDKRIYRIILFWVELLGFPKTRTIRYLNGNKLDLRYRNLLLTDSTNHRKDYNVRQLSSFLH